MYCSKGWRRLSCVILVVGERERSFPSTKVWYVVEVRRRSCLKWDIFVTDFESCLREQFFSFKRHDIIRMHEQASLFVSHKLGRRTGKQNTSTKYKIPEQK